MADTNTRIVLDDFTGGRNGIHSPVGPQFQPTEVVDAVNVDWYHTSGFRKRYGSSNTSMTGSNMSGTVSTLARHVPGTNEADAELWAMDDATAPTIFTRLDNSVTWTVPVSVVDSTSFGTNRYDVTWASLNGLLFVSLVSAVNRLHLYDSGTDSLRRTGVYQGTTAPTAANTAGAGAYPATLRYYRVRYYALAGGAGNRRSEPTPSVAFTPGGASPSVTVTAPNGGTPPTNEGITSWYVEASTDNVTFYVISGLIAIAVGTFVDANLVATYSAGAYELSKLTGTFTLQKSYRLIAADQNRLVGWGSWTVGDKQHRMEFSAVVGSLDQGDAERVDTNTNYFLDFDELDSGPPMALVGPAWGNFYAFKSRQTYELIPTGSIDQPYRRVKLSGELGCVGSHAAGRGEDADGNPCLYILTHRGVYRYGKEGFAYIGQGIEDLIVGPTAILNMAATNVIGHLVYYPDLAQLWVWFATGSSNDPNSLCVLNVKHGGWARYTGSIATARCSVMFANSLGATMGFPLVPYIGSTAAVNRIVKAADSAVTQDAGTNYQASVTTRPLTVPGFRVTVGDAQVLAPAASGVTVTATVTPDFGASATVSGTALLTATGSETRVTRPFVGSALAGAEFLQLTIGDGSALNSAFSVDRVVIPIQSQEPVT